MTKEQFIEFINKDYPNDLNECLMVFENIKYKTFGFPMFYLDYDYSDKTWGVAFRNPKDFANPEINEKTPIEAVHKMFDFLREKVNIINNK